MSLGPEVLTDWNHLKIRFDGIQTLKQKYLKNKGFEAFKQNIPTFYWAEFQLQNGSPTLDTFLNVNGWGKGIAFLNNFNLGRYWPLTGPQLTLYTPKHLFKPYPELNSLVLFELEESPCRSSNDCIVQFVKTHVINGSTPYGQPSHYYNHFEGNHNSKVIDANDTQFGIQLNDIQYI